VRAGATRIAGRARLGAAPRELTSNEWAAWCSWRGGASIDFTSGSGVRVPSLQNAKSECAAKGLTFAGPLWWSGPVPTGYAVNAAGLLTKGGVVVMTGSPDDPAVKPVTPPPATPPGPDPAEQHWQNVMQAALTVLKRLRGQIAGGTVDPATTVPASSANLSGPQSGWSSKSQDLWDDYQLTLQEIDAGRAQGRVIWNAAQGSSTPPGLVPLDSVSGSQVIQPSIVGVPRSSEPFTFQGGDVYDRTGNLQAGPDTELNPYSAATTQYMPFAPGTLPAYGAKSAPATLPAKKASPLVPLVVLGGAALLFGAFRFGRARRRKRASMTQQDNYRFSE